MKYLIDLDGTLLNGESPISGSIEFLGALSSNQIDYRIITNSIASPSSISYRLNAAGFSVTSDIVINPIVSISSFLKYNNIERVCIVGSPSEMDQICIAHSEESPEVVILLDFEKINANYETLQKTLDFMESGIPAISASGSVFYTSDRKRKIDTGAYVLMLEAISSRKISIFGKPSSCYFEQGLSLLGGTSDQTTVIGDDWSTDVVGGKSVGCQTILVRTGKYKTGDEDLGSPDRTVDSLIEVLNG